MKHRNEYFFLTWAVYLFTVVKNECCCLHFCWNFWNYTLFYPNIFSFLNWLFYFFIAVHLLLLSLCVYKWQRDISVYHEPTATGYSNRHLKCRSFLDVQKARMASRSRIARISLSAEVWCKFIRCRSLCVNFTALEATIAAGTIPQVEGRQLGACRKHSPSFVGCKLCSNFAITVNTSPSAELRGFQQMGIELPSLAPHAPRLYLGPPLLGPLLRSHNNAMCTVILVYSGYVARGWSHEIQRPCSI